MVGVEPEGERVCDRVSVCLASRWCLSGLQWCCFCWSRAQSLGAAALVGPWHRRWIWCEQGYYWIHSHDRSMAEWCYRL